MRLRVSPARVQRYQATSPVVCRALRICSKRTSAERAEYPGRDLRYHLLQERDQGKRRLVITPTDGGEIYEEMIPNGVTNVFEGEKS